MTWRVFKVVMHRLLCVEHVNFDPSAPKRCCGANKVPY